MEKLTNEKIQNAIDSKTKPIGSLGKLEKIAFQIAKLQNSISPRLQEPTILVFAGDHGIAKEGVSAYPQEVTFQMVLNFLQGGAAINVLSKQNKIQLKIIDSGVNYDFAGIPELINAKIGYGTKNFLHEKAMSEKEFELSMQKGKEIIDSLKNSNIVGFGEMGIGNTSSASMIFHFISNLPLQDCVGRGTGLDDYGFNHKLSILKQAKDCHSSIHSTLEILQTFGGFEIAQMVGAMLESYRNNKILLIDGFISTSALLVAYKIEKNILNNCLFSHLSGEGPHKFLLDYLEVDPILNLGMRLGEGSGCAVALPIIQSAVTFLNEMASFEEANVSKKSS